ncbi:MAG TPA: hypothetical protein PKA63_07775 [Oligoflexia bacterium]|nr:hypothetical protein [Oligoflexia bacterium]HMP48548.1 hypothetical protein [Oligoflexia bacterium]
MTTKMTNAAVGSAVQALANFEAGRVQSPSRPEENVLQALNNISSPPSSHKPAPMEKLPELRQGNSGKPKKPGIGKPKNPAQIRSQVLDHARQTGGRLEGLYEAGKEQRRNFLSNARDFFRGIF